MAHGNISVIVGIVCPHGGPMNLQIKCVQKTKIIVHMPEFYVFYNELSLSIMHVRTFLE